MFSRQYRVVKNCVSLLLVMVLSACANAPRTVSPSNDEAAIRGVIESFHMALAHRDKPTYLGLFLPGNVSWQSVADDFQLNRERRKNPLAARAQVDSNNTYLTFIDNAVNNPKVGGGPALPSFPINIETDGDVASASQDYRFFYEGREVGRGRSFWLLVRTEQGWKITAVAYSKRRPQAS
jgi:hypothetical protein